MNTQIDFNNCGSIGFVCSMAFISCSYGTCSNAPAVILQNGSSMSGWGGSVTMDDGVANITTPFNVSMYGTSTRTVSLSSNGVNIRYSMHLLD